MGNTGAIYSWLDNNAPNENTAYRISSINIEGKVEYSNAIEIAKVEMKGTASVYPNPVSSGVLNINLGLASGTYSYKIISAGGQMSQSGQFNYVMQTPVVVKLICNVRSGQYFLQVSKNGQVVFNKSISVQ